MKTFIQRYFKPKSTEPDINRKELILNSLLFFSLLLLLPFLALVIWTSIKTFSHIGLIKFSILLIPFVASYYFSRTQKILPASIILISIFTIGAWVAIINWDILLPAALLSLVLCTTIVGNLISSKAGFIYVFVSGILLLIFSQLTTLNILSTDHSWRDNQINILDTIEITLFLLFTSGISWISNRQTELSLMRARQSEQELKIERDTLEVKVIERTREIENIQIEKISELYTFIEFGKISAGLIHDLMSPLTALCIEIESNEMHRNFSAESNALDTNCSNSGNTNHNLHSTSVLNNTEIKQSIKRLLGSSQKVQEIIKAAKNQIKINLHSSTFYPREILEETLMVNQHRIRKAGIQVKLSIPNQLAMTGYHSLFTHICANLMSNAIDACADKTKKHSTSTNSTYPNPASKHNRRETIKYHPQIHITAQINKQNIQLRFKDNGGGIPDDMQQQIFNPFFSTKGDKGCGFGLAASRHIADKYFSATLDLRSFPPGRHRDINDYRTEFLLTFPYSPAVTA